MPDSVGLYAGNPVTQMGFPIGTVKTITSGLSNVRVDFTLTQDRHLPQDVKAIIRSTSVLADRSLELVGNPGPGPQLHAGECIPLTRSFTPKSLSEVIGSANDLVNSIIPGGSTNVGDAIRGIDHAIQNTGPRINGLLTTTSSVLDSPDQTIDAIGSVIRNLAQLTSLIRELRGPLKEILLDARTTMPDVVKASDGANITGPTALLVKMVADIEVTLGETVQGTLDSTSVAVRKLSAHARRVANLLNPLPWWINSMANTVNNHQFGTLRYRPPLYRIQTPDGVALCNIINAATPGGCANVQGMPYAVDVSLLQYVLTQAARR
ncbi:mammalian cell entry protein [Mycobacterium colombiense]|uniref:Mammalian cell entry protein n=2 Tax=Mycobacterium colombiense TaxID=339268 RepID=A0A1A2RLE9_9MYCO|nr:mammalian cell entry protein [Mycobacterium colombiense]